MKTTIIFIFCLELLCINNATPQSVYFDTSYVLISSDDHDIKNPQFDKSVSSVDYFTRDALLAYEKWSSPLNSNISARLITYNSMGSETNITNDGFMNIKPSVAYFTAVNQNNEGAIVYQTNKNGNNDIFFARFNGVTWSTAVPIAADIADENDPSITPYEFSSMKNFIVVYEKNGDVYLKNYYNLNWQNDTNITLSESLYCSTPKISTANYGSHIVVAYLRNLNDTVTSIAYHYCQVNTNGQLSVGVQKTIIQSGSQSNIRFAMNDPAELNYDYDTLGGSSYYSVSPYSTGYNITNQSRIVNGINYCGTGSAHADFTSDFGFYSAICWINELNDSTHIIANARYNPFGVKRFYVGSSSEKTFVNLSPKLVHGGYFRFRMMWEKQLNGRTALYESFMDDRLSDINMISANIPDKFELAQNFPNPFNPETVIEFKVMSEDEVRLVVYDMLGRVVKVLADTKLQPGTYTSVFNGSEISSGVYFYKLTAGDFSATKRMVLTR